MSNGIGNSAVWGTGGMEPRVLQCGLRVEGNRDVFSLGYPTIGTINSSISVTDLMEQEVLHCRVPVEWNREVFCGGNG